MIGNTMFSEFSNISASFILDFVLKIEVIIEEHWRKQKMLRTSYIFISLFIFASVFDKQINMRVIYSKGKVS
jgi:hypothetical protein